MISDPKLLGKIAKIDQTYDTLRYATILTLDTEMAQTREHYRAVPPADAPLTWHKVDGGDQWGDSWWSAWFRTTVTIPTDLDGQTVYLRGGTGGKEAQLLVDGVHYGVFDENHPVRMIALKAVGGMTHTIHLESYSGHTFPGTQPYDEAIAVAGGAPQDSGVFVGKDSRIFHGLALLVERIDVSAFVFELRTLRQMAVALDEHSLRRGRIQAALGMVFEIVYAKPNDTDEALWRPALAEARAIMRPILAERNGSTTPIMGIIGHSHIDTAWLWSISETWRKLARTFSSVLSLMDQYPDFRFTQSAAYHADVIKRLYPDIFKRIQERVAEGRWEINGAMWVEPDCNIPSGESFVRQCLYGQTATREMFGVTSDTLWQPDVFGYSAALPQILRGAGVDYFCTTKLGWNDTNQFPYDTFTWQGMDGTTVLTHFNRIHCWPDPETLIGAWKEVQHKDIQDRRLIAFGYGDGGGGPMAEMIEMGQLTTNLEGCPKAVYTSITEFMDGCRDNLPDLPRWVGELYLELHRGTLTSIAPIKRGNRKCEFALRDAEFVATLAAQHSNAYPKAEIDDRWKQVLLNQFHDILPGSSIAEVNTEAIKEFADCLRGTNAIRNEAITKLATPADVPSIVIANSLSWDRTGEFVMDSLKGDDTPAGDGIVSQTIENVDGQSQIAVTGVSIPALGYTTVAVTPDSPLSGPSPFIFAGNKVETPYASVEFDKAGRIARFYDKAARRELVAPGSVFNELMLGEDVPAAWDNWDIDRDQRVKLRPQVDLVSRELTANGGVQLRIRHKYRIGQASSLVQDIVFHAGTAQVDFDTKVEWHEKYQFLKARFDTALLADSALHEIQFGHVPRPTHTNRTIEMAQFDVCAHKWTDLSEGQFGIAFLNDCKYACTVRGGEYLLSILKSGRHPDARGDEGTHRFAYAILPHNGGFSVESVVRPAYEFNIAPIVALGTAGAPFSLADISATNVIVDAVKQAEDGNGIVLRLYEASRTGTHATINFGVPVSSVAETNLLEEEAKPVALDGNSVSVYFRPFEIKTLLVR